MVRTVSYMHLFTQLPVEDLRIRRKKGLLSNVLALIANLGVCPCTRESRRDGRFCVDIEACSPRYWGSHPRCESAHKSHVHGPPTPLSVSLHDKKETLSRLSPVPILYTHLNLQGDLLVPIELELGAPGVFWTLDGVGPTTWSGSDAEESLCL